jgi:RimJ/RimL family protein N-acetyltransferase
VRDLKTLALPELGDGRLLLRPWQAGDAAACAEMCADPDIVKWIPVPVPYTYEDGVEWVGDAERKWRELNEANFAVCDSAGGELTGSLGVRVDVARESGEFGYLVRREARHTGVASGAVRLLVAWCFDELGLGRLQIRADAANDMSRRVIETCGFQYEGLLRDYDLIRGERCTDVIYSLLPGDPRP